MGTLILQNGYSIRTWYKVPRSDMKLAFDEANTLPAGSNWFIEWTPDKGEEEESVVVGDKQLVEEEYYKFEKALAKEYPERYSPSRNESYRLILVDDRIVRVG